MLTTEPGREGGLTTEPTITACYTYKIVVPQHIVGGGLFAALRYVWEGDFYLSSPTLPVLRALDNTRQIQHLDLRPSVV